MPDSFTIDDLRRVLGADKAREIGRALWAASQRPVPDSQLDALRLLAEGGSLGRASNKAVPALVAYFADNPGMARKVASWCVETKMTGGVPGGLPLELQASDQNGHEDSGTVLDILNALTQDPLSSADIAAQIDRSVATTAVHLRRLHLEGRVRRVPSGHTNPNQGPIHLWRSV